MVPRATNTKNFETDFKVYSQSRKFEFNGFSILHLNGHNVSTITFDVVDRFQENKVFKTAQIINNIPKSSKNSSFVTVETVTFWISSSDKYLFDFNHSNYVVKTEFFKKSSQY